MTIEHMLGILLDEGFTTDEAYDTFDSMATEEDLETLVEFARTVKSFAKMLLVQRAYGG